MGVTRAIGNAQLKKFIISVPDVKQYTLSQHDSLLILATDGLYRTYTDSQIVSKVMALRSAGYNLAQISEKILDECLQLEQNKKTPNDNLTLVIVDVAAYYKASLRLQRRESSPSRVSSNQ